MNLTAPVLGLHTTTIRAFHNVLEEIRTQVNKEIDADQTNQTASYHDGLLRMTSTVVATLLDEAEECRI